MESMPHNLNMKLESRIMYLCIDFCRSIATDCNRVLLIRSQNKSIVESQPTLSAENQPEADSTTSFSNTETNHRHVSQGVSQVEKDVRKQINRIFDGDGGPFHCGLHATERNRRIGSDRRAGQIQGALPM